jgi:hypothetical protein
MKDLLIGIAAMGIGTLLCFAGYKVARILIPIWGFFAGFFMGAAGVSDALNNQFLGTTLGIVVGLILGLVFGLFAYFFFSLAIVLMGASFGYWLGTGLVTMLGFNKGFLSATVGISIGVVFAILAIVINAPKYYLIVTTAFAGAVSVFVGFLILINKINLESLSYIDGNDINVSVLWSILAALLGIFGLIFQVLNNKNQEIEKWGTPFEKPVETSPPSTPAQ